MTMRAAPSLQLSSENLPTEITPPPNMPDLQFIHMAVVIGAQEDPGDPVQSWRLPLPLQTPLMFQYSYLVETRLMQLSFQSSTAPDGFTSGETNTGQYRRCPNLHIPDLV